MAELRVDRVHVIRASRRGPRGAVAVGVWQAQQAGEPHRTRVIEDHANVAGPVGGGRTGLKVRHRQGEDLGKGQVGIHVGRHRRLDHVPVLAGGQAAGKLSLELHVGGIVGVTTDLQRAGRWSSADAQKVIGGDGRLRTLASRCYSCCLSSIAVERPRAGQGRRVGGVDKLSLGEGEHADVNRQGHAGRQGDEKDRDQDQRRARRRKAAVPVSFQETIGANGSRRRVESLP